MLYHTIILLVLTTVVLADNNSLINSESDSHRRLLVKSKLINCLYECVFEYYFNGSFIIPSTCETYVSSRKCSFKFIIDYMKYKVGVLFEYDNQTDTDFDASISAFGEFSMKKEHSSRSVMWTYVCSNHDNCSTNYFNQYIAHYVQLTEQFQTLNNRFSTLLDYIGSNSSKVQQCYNNSDTLQSCIDGSCVYNWVPERNVTAQKCAFPPAFTRVLYEVVQTTRSAQSTPVFVVVTYECNIDKCNSPESVAAVKKAIEEDWGGILNTDSASINRGFLFVFFICPFILKFLLTALN
ncbi:unnamed protein product [Adineta ricciae]|uniref:Uncharacterized protein n=1 Tax=Adineta ricciae TaxID=249248 RepID=A0A815ME22_ADIRI|nr:unnamed protein product [Adineta ricciae]CAF1500273.1 unnamed protein product [Adineta ricciae]